MVYDKRSGPSIPTTSFFYSPSKLTPASPVFVSGRTCLTDCHQPQRFSEIPKMLSAHSPSCSVRLRVSNSLLQREQREIPSGPQLTSPATPAPSKEYE
ncbi:hypothetical protein Mp_8g02330 [Marchantia polymorpha subsp. ruderalis]|uniref:Uncharacterized protein n=1 Tax=Marchantia polymorpha TaxID=3197 RepID=A0A2R6XIX4_MARPO|nr:hypothetical protein MARPO_0012s0030 [Marchantia polymorpha]BBN18420.1 hypothetical protein Mp_8g02330 [Marchantia polymorpha subsp. ruderalis]|eukprot:PTQ46067.1 hypothetical protein MARPO_0012s0030 [Marchantia polymorpha]